MDHWIDSVHYWSTVGTILVKKIRGRRRCDSIFLTAADIITVPIQPYVEASALKEILVYLLIVMYAVCLGGRLARECCFEVVSLTIYLYR